MITGGNMKKGDVLGISRIAAIQGAKRAADLIPLAHPLALTRVAVDFTVDTAANAITCIATVEKRTAAPALRWKHSPQWRRDCSPSMTCLKRSISAMRMQDIGLEEKLGGKSEALGGGINHPRRRSYCH
jgi:cyclic pyranopterin phosphate synthase